MIPVQHHIDTLASYGRNGDNTLMHVSHDEVKYLSGLGALTRNPVTGLPEAFQLMDLLPVVAGIAGGMFGAPMLGAAVSGVGTAVHSHSLGQGLLAGLSSWGMGSLLNGAGTAATSAAGSAAGAPASSALADASGQTAMQGLGSSAGGANANAFLGGQAPGTLGGTAASQAASTAPTAASGAQPFSWGTAQNNLTNMDWLGTQKPAMYAAGAGMYGLNAMQEAAALKAQSDALNANNQAKLNQEHQQYAYAASQAHNVNPYNAYYQQGNPYMTTAATGGLIGDQGLYGVHPHGIRPDAHHPHDGVSMTSVYGHGFSTGALVGDNGRWEPQEATHGPHGIEGLLKGPGDGMSDHIEATIEGHTPARLANDEFVIPADVVSHLGNGSTSAGAKHLYSMMERIRKARVGHPKQGKQIDPEEHLPA